MRGGLQRVSELLPAGPESSCTNARGRDATRLCRPLFLLPRSALGVELMRFVFLLKLELQDASDSLDVFLWRDAVSERRTTLRGHRWSLASS